MNEETPLLDILSLEWYPLKDGYTPTKLVFRIYDPLFHDQLVEDATKDLIPMWGYKSEEAKEAYWREHPGWGNHLVVREDGLIGFEEEYYAIVEELRSMYKSEIFVDREMVLPHCIHLTWDKDSDTFTFNLAVRNNPTSETVLSSLADCTDPYDLERHLRLLALLEY